MLQNKGAETGTWQVMMRAKIFNAFVGIVGLFAVLLSAPAWAAAPRLFAVTGITVDVTADSAQTARMQAQSQGEKKAYDTLMRRLTLSAYHDRLPQLSAQRISELIQDFSVADEKVSSVRYLAKLSYHFRAPAVRALLDERSIPFAETESKPVLMLPVYQVAGALLLWDDPNPWRAAWDKMTNGASGLVPMVLPIGDLQDVRVIGAEQAIEGDTQRLEAIAQRYATGDVVVAHGILRMDADYGLPELEVYLTRFGSALQEHTVVKSFTAQAGEDVNVLLARAVQELKNQVEDNWKQDNLIQAGEAQVLPLQVRVSGLKNWLSIRGRLNGVAIVRRAEVVLLRRGVVRMNLHFIGDAEQLALSLDQADLVLWEEAGNWYLGQKANPQAAPQFN